MIDKALLQRHPFTRGLSEAQVAQIASCARHARVAEGAFVFREGEGATELYLLLQGRIALEQYVPGKGAVQLESLLPDEILGLSWILPGGRWILDARVVEPAELIVVDAPCLLERMEHDTALGFALSKHLIQALYARLERTRLQRLDVYRQAPW